MLKAESVSVRGGVKLLSSPALLVQPQWRIHTLTEQPLDTQVHTHTYTCTDTVQAHKCFNGCVFVSFHQAADVPSLMTVSEVLHSRYQSHSNSCLQRHTSVDLHISDL